MRFLNQWQAAQLLIRPDPIHADDADPAVCDLILFIQVQVKTADLPAIVADTAHRDIPQLFIDRDM